LAIEVLSAAGWWSVTCFRKGICSTRIYPMLKFVMPQRAEGFGFTNIEAMSFGLP